MLASKVLYYHPGMHGLSDQAGGVLLLSTSRSIKGWKGVRPQGKTELLLQDGCRKMCREGYAYKRQSGGDCLM